MSALKVYCETPPSSLAMNRVVAALKFHVPLRAVEFVPKEEDANLVVLHVIGYPETQAAVERIVDRGQEYAIIQYCMRSTQQPHTRAWRDIWTNAKLVWSYYDLLEFIRQDATDEDPDFAFHFYCSPLGVDPVFCATEPVDTKSYTMLTSGYVAESEGVSEVAEAIRRIGGRHFHLGPRNVAPNANVLGMGISDPALASVYARCCWVAGLRRAEGFEMPAAEGLVCGARPIMFDAVHYRRWFEPWAQFIPEGNFGTVVEALIDIFEGGCRLVTNEERYNARMLFDWKIIAGGFWEGVL